MKRSVRIIGATAGIAKVYSEILATNGDRLILTGRPAERLAPLKAEDVSDVVFMQGADPSTLALMT